MYILSIHCQTYITLWIEETPPTLVEEALGIIVDGLHDFGPIQTLHSLSILDVTRTVVVTKVKRGILKNDIIAE